MELANCLLNLGGDIGQQVPKVDVTPSEVAVLRVLHGNDAVNDIQVTGSVDRSSSAERARLVHIYGRGLDGEIRSPAVERLFPGVAARLFESFDELETPETEEFSPPEKITRIEPATRGRKKKAVEEPEAQSALE